MRKKWMLLLALAGVLTLTAACSGKTTETGETEAEETATEEAAAEETTTATASVLTDSKIVKLGTYKGVEVEAIDTDVTDEEIQEQIDTLLENNQETRSIEDKTVVEDGDTVIIDYVGRQDGEAFDGGTAEDAELTIGSGSFIDGFEDGLLGKTVGETCELNLTFPEDYWDDETAGAEVVFEVTVKDIVEYVTPDWTDEFVAANTEYDSIEAYTEGMRAYLQETKEENAKEEQEYNVLEAIINDSEFECGENDLENKKETLKESIETQISYYGMDMETYLGYVGMTEDEFEVQVLAQAEYQIQSQLVMEAIQEAESIALTEDEYQEGLAELAEEYYADSAEAFEEQYGRDLIEENLLYDKTMEFLLENAVEK